MDLLSFWNIIRQQNKIVVVGLTLTVLLGLAALLSVSSSGVELRSPPKYVAKTTLFVTQSGFPWGRTALDEYVKARGAGKDAGAIPRFADPARMEYLASLYSQFAESDGVRSIVRMKSGGKIDGRYEAAPVRAGDGTSLPLIEISAVTRSRRGAIALANTVAAALPEYLTANQEAGAVLPENRISLPVIEVAIKADVYQGVRLTTPIMAILLGLIATSFIAFSAHNLSRARTGVGSVVPITGLDLDSGGEVGGQGTTGERAMQPPAQVETVGHSGAKRKSRLGSD